MISGDIVKCRMTGSVGVIAKNPKNHRPEQYKVFWLDDAVETYTPTNELEEILFNPDDTLDVLSYVPSID